MTANFTGGGRGGAFTYASSVEPTDPVQGETWWNPDTSEAKVYLSNGTWDLLTVTDHSEIGNVSKGQHRTDSQITSLVHDRPSPGNALAEDANGNFDVQEGGIDYGNLAGTPNSTSGIKNQTTTFTLPLDMTATSRSILQFCDAAKIDVSNSDNNTMDVDWQVHFADGTTNSYTTSIPGGSSVTETKTFASTKMVESIEITFVNTTYTSGSIYSGVVRNAPHSHSL